MRVCVMSRPMAEEYSDGKHDESAILISIASKDQSDANVSCNPNNNLKDILFLHFNDTDSLDKDSGHIVDEDAEQIKDFVNKYKDTDIDTLIVHCGAGQSRSAGVAAAILMYLNGDDRQIYDDKKYTPNRLCYSTVLRAFNGETDYASIFGDI